MNLLMLSGDTAIGRGQSGAFSDMLALFAPYWSRIDILTPPGPGGSYRELYGRVLVHPSTLPRWQQPRYLMQKGHELLRVRPYALIISHDYGLFYNGLAAYRLSRRHNIPYVSEIHHIEGYPRAVTPKERFYRGLARLYAGWVGRHAAAIRTVNAREVPEFLRAAGVPAAKIRVLPSLYLDLETFRPLPDVTPRYDVLFVGRLASNKGLFTLLEAIQAVKTTHPGVTLAIRGEGALFERLQAAISEKGLRDNVTFLPRAEDSAALARLYQEARMLVCASTAEGGPRVTIEAMACGVPVISTPVGVMPDVIRHGENGLLFEGSATTLAEHIRNLLDNPDRRERFGEAGRAAVQPFAAHAAIERYARAYHALIEGK